MLDLKKWVAKVTEALKVDFIVEQGTFGIWTYRKWNSGIAECWGRASGNWAINTASTSYGGYRSGALTLAAFPFAFVSAPSITATTASSGGCWVNNITATTTGGSFYFSGGSSMAAATRTVSFYVIGKWK